MTPEGLTLLIYLVGMFSTAFVISVSGMSEDAYSIIIPSIIWPLIVIIGIPTLLLLGLPYYLGKYLRKKFTNES